VLVTIGFVDLALFLAALAAGAPWGEAAWGGGDSQLSATQRGASAVAAVIYIAAALIVLGRAGASLQHHKPQALAFEVPGDRQTGLAAADHDCRLFEPKRGVVELVS
jgi:hypothetical protein